MRDADGEFIIGIIVVVVFVLMLVVAHLNSTPRDEAPRDYSGTRIAHCQAAAEYLNNSFKEEVHDWYMDNCRHLETG